MVAVEAFIVLSLGLILGILSTVIDVVAFGVASILSHFSLLVLLNALLAVHIDSRSRAIWYAIPFNLGYLVAYFITTVASFEGYSKSLMVPLAAVSLIAPFLAYGVWVAKREKNFYGRFLGVLIVAGTLLSSYAINKSIGAFDVVVCILLAFVLFVMPVRRLKISRGVHPVTDAEADELPSSSRRPVAARAEDEEPKRPRRRVRRSNKRRDGAQDQRPVAKETPRRGTTQNRRVRRGDEEKAKDAKPRRRTRKTTPTNRGTARNGAAPLGYAQPVRRSERSA